MRNWKEEIRRRLAALKLAPTREQEIIEELSQHLEDRFRELLACGVSEDQARRAAISELSDGEALQRRLRPVQRQLRHEPPVVETEGRNMIGGLIHDFRYGLRMVRKNPGFIVVAALTLALGICGVTTQFSVLDAALLRGLPFPEPERLVRVAMRDPSWEPDRDRSPWLSDVLEFQKRDGIVRRSCLLHFCRSGNGHDRRHAAAVERKPRHAQLLLSAWRETSSGT